MFNCLKPSGKYAYQLLKYKKKKVYLNFTTVCSVRNNKQQLLPCTRYNRLVFITQTECVYCAVRTEFFKHNSDGFHASKLETNLPSHKETKCYSLHLSQPPSACAPPSTDTHRNTPAVRPQSPLHKTHLSTEYSALVQALKSAHSAMRTKLPLPLTLLCIFDLKTHTIKIHGITFHV